MNVVQTEMTHTVETIAELMLHHGSIEAIKTLLKSGVEWTRPQTSTGLTLVYTAISHNRSDVLKIMYETDESSMIEYEGEIPVLYWAVCCEAVSCVEFLLQHVPNIMVNAVWANRLTALGRAVQQNSLMIVRILLSHGANVNTMGNLGLPPIYYAVRDGLYEIAKVLILAGATIAPCHPDDDSPLTIAASRGDLPMVKLLVRQSTCSKEATCDFALHRAVAEGHIDIVEFLIIEAFVNVQAARTSDGFQPIHVAATSCNSLKLLTLLTNYGANVMARTRSGHRPLTLALFAGHAHAVVWLMKQEEEFSLAKPS